jgi:hypothetical protein
VFPLLLSLLLSLLLQAVIGAGAAGLVSIRELLKEGHQVTPACRQLSVPIACGVSALHLSLLLQAVIGAGAAGQHTQDNAVPMHVHVLLLSLMLSLLLQAVIRAGATGQHT